MNQVVSVVCSDLSCKYNSGNGYYGTCNHPSIKDLVSYAGIDRYLRSTCGARESMEKHQGDIQPEHSEFIEFNLTGGT